MEIPLDYIIQNLYTHCKRPSYRKNEGVYNAECCVCKEGKSSGTKRRLFYFPNERYFYCFNCSKSWSDLSWLTSVTGMTVTDILKDAGEFLPTCTSFIDTNEQQKVIKEVPAIPPDSIDLLSVEQCEYYKDRDEHDLITQATQYCKQRRLFTAINRPKTFYVSPNDAVHAKRLIIPFYDESGRISSYQSRSLSGDDYPKYLTKYGDKGLFGEHTVRSELPYLFITEGPIDAMFIQNGVGLGGAKVTERQELYLARHFDKQHIYIYDNDTDNEEMQKTVQKAIAQNKNIFVWPKELKKFKDINEVCCHLNINSVSIDFILKHTYTGLEASVKYKLSLL